MSTTNLNIRIYNCDKTVHTSSDYDLFNDLTGNRDVLEDRIKKIRDSIVENGYVCNPIVVNEKMEVIDGQGRLGALKKLGLPVDYIVVPGCGIEECIAMNIAMTNWNTLDYIESYAARGFKDYTLLKKLTDKYKGVISLANIYTAATGIEGRNIPKKNPRRPIQNGQRRLRQRCKTVGISNVVFGRLQKMRRKN